MILVLTGCGETRLDASNLDTFKTSLDAMKEDARISDNVTPSTEETLNAIELSVGLAFMADGLGALGDRSGATKAELKQRIEEKMSKVIKPFDGLTLQDVSSKNERFVKAFQESQLAMKPSK